MDGAELGEGMEIDRVVLPLASSEAAAAATAATGRARFAYLAQTGAKAPPGEAARPDYGANLGRDALQMVYAKDVGYAREDAPAPALSLIHI